MFYLHIFSLHRSLESVCPHRLHLYLSSVTTPPFCSSSQIQSAFKTRIVLIDQKDFGLVFSLQIVIALEEHTAFEFLILQVLWLKLFTENFSKMCEIFSFMY